VRIWVRQTQNLPVTNGDVS